LTSKGSLSGQLQRAIAAGDVLAVRSLAAEHERISLPVATQITLLLLECEPESYETAARRLIARLASERDIPLSDLVDIAAILEHLRTEPLDASRRELLKLVRGAPRGKV
jgi:hypothetical protein